MTGVQTCALPIWPVPLAAVGVGDVAAIIAALEPTASVDVSEAGTGALRAAVASLQLVGAPGVVDDLAALRAAIAGVGVGDPTPTVPELDRRLARDL